MRLLFLLCLASPAAAWEFAPGPPCTLSYEEAGVAVKMTHDPTQPLYTIAISRAKAWPDAPVFSLTFGTGLTITTNQHALSNGGTTLSVADRGFGNVIQGIAAGGTALAQLGDVTVPISTDGAAEPMADYAACDPQPAV